MKFFVTGVGGQLGHDVMNELLKRGHEGVGSDIQENYSGVADGSAVTKAPYVALDITNKDAVEKVIKEVNPDAVIHCAAWTAVDMAEDDDKVTKVRAINAGGTQNIADVCKKLDCKMTYISTDYVFDGQGTEPWQPDCKDYKPLNVYGQTKLEGELAVSQTLEKYFIVRIAWVFGLNGKNFIKTMLNVGKTHDTVRVVNDQIGTPTYTYDLARLLVDMNETEKYGYYHATNEGGYISWYDFTKEIYRQAGYKMEVLPVTTAEYGLSKAARPFNSRLDKSKLVENGFNVTQATISRDIRELNLTKIATKGGKQKYAVQSSSDIVSNSKYMRVLNDGIITMDTAGNILVVKTVSGMAMAVAAALDAMQIKEILGCIAGDDTIMCVVKHAEETDRVKEHIESFIR